MLLIGKFPNSISWKNRNRSFANRICGWIFLTILCIVLTRKNHEECSTQNKISSIYVTHYCKNISSTTIFKYLCGNGISTEVVYSIHLPINCLFVPVQFVRQNNKNNKIKRNETNKWCERFLSQNCYQDRALAITVAATSIDCHNNVLLR